MFDDETLTKLHTYAKDRGFDEAAFIREVERATRDLGMFLNEAIPYAEKVFKESAYKAKAAGPKEAGRGSGGKIAPPKPAAATSPDVINQYKQGMDEAQKFKREGRPTPQTAFDKLTELVGSDLIEVFSDYGLGKSRLLGHIALEAQEAGKRVLFLDNENSLPKSVSSKLKNYEYIGIDLDKNIERVSNIREHYDLVCLDSIGFCTLIRYFELPLKERLSSIGRMIVLRGYLKDFAIRHKGLAIAANQLESEFATVSKGTAPENLEAFGGKGSFISKLLIKLRPIERNPERLKVGLHVFKARDIGYNTKLAEFIIDSKGTRIEWKR